MTDDDNNKIITQILNLIRNVDNNADTLEILHIVIGATITLMVAHTPGLTKEEQIEMFNQITDHLHHAILKNSITVFDLINYSVNLED